MSRGCATSMRGCKVSAEVAPFFTDLPARIAAAHLVVSRSGASTVAELAAIGRPAILVPLPHALDQDQPANAAVLEAGRRRNPAAPGRLHAGPAGRRDHRACHRAAKARRNGRRRQVAGRIDAAERLADLVLAYDGKGMIPKKPLPLAQAQAAVTGFRNPAKARIMLRQIRGAGPRMKLPRDIGPIHFVGIGGIGMSGIAEVLVNLGYTVQGSDAADSANVKRLRDKGAKVVDRPRRAAISATPRWWWSRSAIKRDNPELVAARAKRLPVVRRAEMLAELMRLKRCVAIAGTHGKTTTTSLVAALLDAGGFDPTVINGGIINAYGTNARLGAGDWMVVEADESDGTFLKLPADVAIVTNVDPEHLDHFKTFDAVQEAFRAFVENVPFYGFAVMCTDHPVVQQLVGRIEDRRVITYGENPQADVRLIDLDHADGQSRFSVRVPRPRRRDRARDQGPHAADAGPPQRAQRHRGDRGRARARHRRRRDPQGAARASAACERRFTRTGEWNGVPIIDDYGHHPVEIAAVLRAARESTKGQVIAVVQPHRYTRLASLFEQFSHLLQRRRHGDRRARLSGRRGADRGRRSRRAGAGPARARPSPGDPARRPAATSPRIVKRLAQPGDIVVCLGAGNITQWAYALPGELAALDKVA